jgi:hypothetical protein
MKFKHPSEGSVRIKKKFLFFPKRIRGETRWLMVAEWQEKYSDCIKSGYWLEDRWLEPSTFKEDN